MEIRELPAHQTFSVECIICEISEIENMNCRYSNETRVESGRGFSCANWKSLWNWMWPASRSASSRLSMLKSSFDQDHRSRSAFRYDFPINFFMFMINFFNFFNHFLKFPSFPDSWEKNYLKFSDLEYRIYTKNWIQLTFNFEKTLYEADCLETNIHKEFFEFIQFFLRRIQWVKITII